MSLDQFKGALELCTYCPKLCRHTCPVGNVERREAVIPQAKMATANGIRKGHIAISEEMASVFYHCNGCGLCGEYCEHDVEVTPVLFAARELAVRHGVAFPTLKGLPDRFYARNETLVRALHQLVDDRYFVEDAQVAYFPACEAIETAPQSILDTLKIFEALGLDYVAVQDGENSCAGYPLWAAGHFTELHLLAKEIGRKLSRYKRVVTDCPSCLWVMKHVYPQMGVHITAELLHVTEFLDTQASRLTLQHQLPVAFYHDPCYLGRFLGVFDAPRRLLRRAVEEVREFAWNREQGQCCGGGGLVPDTLPDVASQIAHRRMEEVFATEVPLVVTACYTCEHRLRAQSGEVEVSGLMSLLARLL